MRKFRGPYFILRILAIEIHCHCIHLAWQRFNTALSNRNKIQIANVNLV